MAHLIVGSLSNSQIHHQIRHKLLQPSVESSFLLCQMFTPCQLSRDNTPNVLLFFLTFLHAKDIWRNIHVHVFQCGLQLHLCFVEMSVCCCSTLCTVVINAGKHVCGAKYLCHRITSRTMEEQYIDCP